MAKNTRSAGTCKIDELAKKSTGIGGGERSLVLHSYTAGFHATSKNDGQSAVFVRPKGPASIGRNIGVPFFSSNSGSFVHECKATVMRFCLQALSRTCLFKNLYKI